MFASVVLPPLIFHCLGLPCLFYSLPWSKPPEEELKYCRDSYTAIYIFYLDNKSGKTLRQSSLETRRQSRHFTSLFYQFPLIQSVFVKHILFMPHLLSISGNFHETYNPTPCPHTRESLHSNDIS